MASGRMHPVAEAAFRAIGKAGKKALERAGVEAASTLADSLLEDVERGGSGIAGKVREVRNKIQERKEETMAGRKKGRRAAEEEEEDLEEEEEDGEEEEEDDDDETALIFDAEVMVRNALYVLEVAAEKKKSLRKIVSRLEEIHEEIADELEDEEEQEEDE